MVKSPDDELAELYTRIQTAAQRTGRALHDDVGPLLSAAGLHLQLLRMDHPQLERDIGQITGVLDQACERVRAVSQELAPSPVLRGGLKNALERLAALVATHPRPIAIQLKYQIPAKLPTAELPTAELPAAELPIETACALYQAAGAAVAAAVDRFEATRIAITAGGSRQISIRIADNGRTRGRAKALRAAFRIAAAQGLSVALTTKQDTIVLIRYALRRPTGG
jgi:signal transduction histidine kinase